MTLPERSPTAPATRRRLPAVAALLCAATLGLAACGGSDEPEPAAAVSPGGDSTEVVDISGTEPVGEKLAGSVAPLVQCRDWNGASEDEKLATIEDVRSQINLEDSGISAPALTDDEAMELFDGACEPAYAQGFRLYKLYARSAGFVELKRMIEEDEG